MKENRSLVVLSAFFILAILTAIYFQLAFVKSQYDEQFMRVEEHLLDLFDDSIYDYREAVIPKSDSVSLKNLEINISSLILKNTDYPDYIEGDLEETKSYLSSVVITSFKLTQTEFSIVLDTLANKAIKEGLTANFLVELYPYTEYINYKKLHEEKDILMAYSAGVVSFDFTNKTLFLLSRIKYITLSALIVVIAVLLTSFLLIKRYFKERRLSKYKNDFINNLTHELQTPVTISNLALERLNKDLIGNENLSRYVDIAQLENIKIGNLVKRILKLAELENTKVAKSKINVDSTIKEVVIAYNSIIEVTDAIKTQLNYKPNTLKVNKEQFVDLIDNLISNAIKYSSTPRNIVISTDKKNNKLRLSVADNGIGIPSEFTEKVFLPFFKVPNDNVHDIKSHGLGLSYVAEIIKNMKGTITFNSELNKGTTFTILIPDED